MEVEKPSVAEEETNTDGKRGASVSCHKRWLSSPKRSALRTGYEPRRVWRPNLKAIRKLRRDLEELPVRRRVTAGQLSAYVATVLRVCRRLNRLETLVSLDLHRWQQVQYRLRLTQKLVNHHNLNQTLAWLMARRDGAGKNVHAVALAGIGQLRNRRTREYYAAIGRKGAEARWRRTAPNSGASEAPTLPAL